MGLCFTTSSPSPEDKREINQSNKLDKDMEFSKNKEKKILKILLLGTGESGKSTVFKQMQILYQGGFNEMVRQNFKAVVHKNVLDAMQQLIRACEGKLSLPLETPEEKNAAKFILSIENITFDNTERVTPALELLWNSASIRQAYSRRSEFYLIDSAE
jgi:guanine nucleotide-binding protein G(i) subunit alpha